MALLRASRAFSEVLAKCGSRLFVCEWCAWVGAYEFLTVSAASQRISEAVRNRLDDGRLRQGLLRQEGARRMCGAVGGLGPPRLQKFKSPCLLVERGG